MKQYQPTARGILKAVVAVQAVAVIVLVVLIGVGA